MSCFRELATALALFCAGPAVAGEPVALTHDTVRKLAPVFMPGGEQIVYAAHEQPNLVALVRLNVRDGTRQRLHPEIATHQFDPAFSADGHFHAYSRTTTSPQSELVIVDLRNPRETVFRPRDSRATARHPSFAPDNSRIAFTLSDVNGHQVASVDLTGNDLKLLAPSGGLSGWPAYSPDGKRIAFASSREGDFEIYVMTADGSQVRRLTRSPGRDLSPAWSPDGSRVAFVSTRDGDEEIYVMDSDGSNARNLTNNPDRDTDPAWHPDGKQIVFVSERSGSSELYMIDVGGDAK
jgi:TolB protein